jgi:hypothetical protein
MLIPSIGLLLPIGGQHLPCRLLEVVAAVTNVAWLEEYAFLEGPRFA